jgi:hypothetical protein
VVGLRTAIADGSVKIEEVQQEDARLKADLSDCGSEVKKDLAKLESGLAKLKQEVRTMKPKPQPVASLAADLPIIPAPKADTTAQKPSASNSQPPRTHFHRRRYLLQWRYCHHEPR